MLLLLNTFVIFNTCSILWSEVTRRRRVGSATHYPYFWLNIFSWAFLCTSLGFVFVSTVEISNSVIILKRVQSLQGLYRGKCPTPKEPGSTRTTWQIQPNLQMFGQEDTFHLTFLSLLMVLIWMLWSRLILSQTIDSFRSVCPNHQQPSRPRSQYKVFRITLHLETFYLTYESRCSA